ncbi:hypothetical protein KSP40_PGU015948 [Platanthera guangdongensis]|uniref:Uncharacterized protein n=1 Tax=Platanthera guangdongensis TaxID=2320717 RepID=A0ABR2LM64_9ASPA
MRWSGRMDGEKAEEMVVKLMVVGRCLRRRSRRRRRRRNASSPPEPEFLINHHVIPSVKYRALASSSFMCLI